jgi:hypothetical protein
MRWHVLILTLTFLIGIGMLVQRRLARSPRFAMTQPSAGRADALTGGGVRTQAPLSEDEPDWAQLKFTIANIRRDQRMTEQPPYYTDGGTWTVFDCKIPGPPPAVFTVAVDAPKPLKGGGDDVPVSFSNVMLLPASGANGDNAVAAFASAFHAEPPPRRAKQPLVPTRFGTALLGTDLHADPRGGFSGSGGKWTATKWFCDAAGYEAEVFFNYNLADGVGEFAEKDTDYRADLVNVIALVMRDGPRPPRTPENDPNLAAAGPRVEELKAIPNSKDAQFLFSPGGKRLVVHKFEPGRSIAFMIDPAKPTEQTPVAQLEGWMSQVICFDGEVTRVAVEEQMVKDLKSFSGDAPRRIFIIDRATGQRKRVDGPWGEQGSLVDQHVLAPDRRYLAIRSIVPAPAAPAAAADAPPPPPGAKGRRQVVWHLYDVAAGSSVQANLPPEAGNAQMLGWTDRGAGLRAVMKTGDRYDDDGPRQTLLIDPATGSATHSSVQPASVDPSISPDGSLRMTLAPGRKLDVLDIHSGRLRTFTFHEDDRRFAEDEWSLEWLSPRYIRFDAQRPGFIDVRTMKLSYLPRVAGAANDESAGGDGEEEDKPYFRYSPDFAWGVTRGANQELLVGRVIVPE